MKKDKAYLLDTLEAIADIEKFLENVTYISLNFESRTGLV